MRRHSMTQIVIPHETTRAGQAIELLGEDTVHW